MVILYELTVLRRLEKYRVCVLRDPYGAAILYLVLGHVR